MTNTRKAAMQRDRSFLGFDESLPSASPDGALRDSDFTKRPAHALKVTIEKLHGVTKTLNEAPDKIKEALESSIGGAAALVDMLTGHMVTQAESIKEQQRQIAGL